MYRRRRSPLRVFAWVADSVGGQYVLFQAGKEGEVGCVMLCNVLHALCESTDGIGRWTVWVRGYEWDAFDHSVGNMWVMGDDAGRTDFRADK